MLHDLRHAVRGLLKSPGFAAMSILTLALGVGGNTAVLSLARAVFYNPLPFKDPDRLVAIAERRPSSRNTNIPVSGHEFAAWRVSGDAAGSVDVCGGDDVAGSGRAVRLLDPCTARHAGRSVNVSSR